jgi:microcystin-dependent protein
MPEIVTSPFTYEAEITAPPGSGCVRLNNSSSVLSVTTCWLSKTMQGGGSISISGVAPGDFINIVATENEARWMQLQLPPTGTPIVDSGSYWTISIAEASGALFPPDVPVEISFTRAPPTAALPASTVLVPVGSCIPYAGSTSPDTVHWLLAQGQSFLRADYPELFAAIGTQWGAADGTHFSVPDMRERVPVGAGSVLALAATEGLAEISRHVIHHHQLAAAVTLSTDGAHQHAAVADHQHAAVGDHQHPGVGDHIHANAGNHNHGSAGNHAHGIASGALFAITGAQLVAASGSARYAVGDWRNLTDSAGDHSHSDAGDHSHGYAGSHAHGFAGAHQHAAAGGHQHASAGAHTHTGSVSGNTSGGGPSDGPSYAVLNYLIRAR